jgi:rhodanese-related sulfurtransferase
MKVGNAILYLVVFGLGLVPAACTGGAATPVGDGAGSLAALSTEAQAAIGPAGDQLVPVAHVMEAVRAGVVIAFVDARTPADYAFGHIPGAVSVPYYEVDKHIGELDPKRLTITYCECPHSEAVQVADALTAAGFANVKAIDEGLFGWTQGGGELIASTATPPPTE